MDSTHRIPPLARDESRPGSNRALVTERSLTEFYTQYFKVVLADTPAVLDEAYRLRYQVYCVENPFENRAEHADGREIDEYDDRAVHSLLIHRPTGSIAGTVRLVLPRHGKRLPITHVSRHPLLTDPEAIAPETTAEISRFAVSKQFRRRATDRLGIDAGFIERRGWGDQADRRVIPHVTLGLMNAIVRMSAEHGITHWCAVMEPALLRLLGRLGIEFEPLGSAIDYHGVRQPCHGDVKQILAGLHRRRPDAWELITERGRLFGKNEAAPQQGALQEALS